MYFWLGEMSKMWILDDSTQDFWGFSCRRRLENTGKKQILCSSAASLALPKISKIRTLILGYGCFLKWWYLQIIHFNSVFHYKPSILGAHPYFRKPPIFSDRVFFITYVQLCNPNNVCYSATLWTILGVFPCSSPTPNVPKHYLTNIIRMSRNLKSEHCSW